MESEFRFLLVRVYRLPPPLLESGSIKVDANTVTIALALPLSSVFLFL